MLCFCQLSAREFSVQTSWTKTRNSARLETSTSRTFGKGFSSSVAWRQDLNKFINLCCQKDEYILTDDNKHLLITNTVCNSVEYSHIEQESDCGTLTPGNAHTHTPAHMRVHTLNSIQCLCLRPTSPPSPSLSGMAWTEGPSCFSLLPSEVHMSLDQSSGWWRTTCGRPATSR